MFDRLGSSLNLSHQASIAHPSAPENVGNDKGNALGLIQCGTLRALKGRNTPMPPFQGSRCVGRIDSQGVALGCPIVPFQGKEQNPHAEDVARLRNVDHPRLKYHTPVQVGRPIPA